MRCYFHNQQNHFLDYFNDPVLNGVVIYVADISSWYIEKEGTYREVDGVVIYVADIPFWYSERRVHIQVP